MRETEPMDDYKDRRIEQAQAEHEAALEAVEDESEKWQAKFGLPEA